MWQICVNISHYYLFNSHKAHQELGIRLMRETGAQFVIEDNLVSLIPLTEVEEHDISVLTFNSAVAQSVVMSSHEA